MSYTHPRFYKAAGDRRWFAVGADCRHLIPRFLEVVNGIAPFVDVKLASGQIVRMKPLTPEKKRLRALGIH